MRKVVYAHIEVQAIACTSKLCRVEFPRFAAAATRRRRRRRRADRRIEWSGNEVAVTWRDEGMRGKAKGRSIVEGA